MAAATAAATAAGAAAAGVAIIVPWSVRRAARGWGRRRAGLRRSRGGELGSGDEPGGCAVSVATDACVSVAALAAPAGPPSTRRADQRAPADAFLPPPNPPPRTVVYARRSLSPEAPSMPPSACCEGPPDTDAAACAGVRQQVGWGATGAPPSAAASAPAATAAAVAVSIVAIAAAVAAVAMAATPFFPGVAASGGRCGRPLPPLLLPPPPPPLGWQPLHFEATSRPPMGEPIRTGANRGTTSRCGMTAGAVVGVGWPWLRSPLAATVCGGTRAGQPRGT